ncbi:MAG: hypothetical protein WD042_04065 [Phycisphaeraceae bacterium]
MGCHAPSQVVCQEFRGKGATAYPRSDRPCESPQAPILAIDLGKFKSVACLYLMQSGEHTWRTVATTPAAVQDLIAEVEPARVVIEMIDDPKRFRPALSGASG